MVIGEKSYTAGRLACRALESHSCLKACCQPKKNKDGKNASSTSSELDMTNCDAERDADPSCRFIINDDDDMPTKSISRGNWVGRLDFFLSCVGYAVGLGNIWRFPYLCYQSGGGAFLLPYFMFLVLTGMPLFLLEVSFGQFANLGPITIWKISPIFKGLGYGMVIISGIVCIYYNIIIAWTLYYAFLSLRTNVPWASCDNWWNTDNCVDGTGEAGNATVASVLNSTAGKVTASEEFWNNYVLQLSSGIEDLGGVRIELLVTLLLAWILVFACLYKGVESSGKVVYVSATFPYLVLIILLIFGVTRPGAVNGILFFLTPRWELLKSYKVWLAAATQIFYSVSTAWGGVLTMSSYNKFNNNCYRDAILVPLINCGTSVLAGFVVFSVVGFMAHATGRPVDQVVGEGPGLAFIVYPEAVTHLPVPPLWAFMFFAMLFAIGLDSQFGMFECVISSLADEFPIIRRKKRLVTVALCAVLFLLGIPCVTRGGMYVLQLMDWYSATMSLMIISFFEAIVIGWIYGADRFLEDIRLMTGHRPSVYYKLCWKFITPTVIFILLVCTIVTHSPVRYNSYEYPTWSMGLGWAMAACSVIPIPVIACAQVIKAFRRLKKSRRTWKEAFRLAMLPTSDWGPSTPANQKLYEESLQMLPSCAWLRPDDDEEETSESISSNSVE